MSDKIIYKGIFVMKNKITQLFLLLALIVGASLSEARAISPYKLNIPFDFTVNGKLLKAGKYSIKFGVSSSKSSVFLLRSLDGDDVAIISPVATLTVLGEIDYVSAVFEKNGDVYSLSEIYSPGISVAITKLNSNQNSFKVIRVNNK
jgi:hypothetical protein